MTSTGKAGDRRDDTGDEVHRRAMGLLAVANRAELEAAWNGLAGKPATQMVRGPETGLVMVRGRIGGGGAAFNLGEATVSRASIRLEDGTIGHAHALGGDRETVRLAAIFDGLFQQPAHRADVERLLDVVAARLRREDEAQARQTAATRVDFFTMVRGED